MRFDTVCNGLRRTSVDNHRDVFVFRREVADASQRHLQDRSVASGTAEDFQDLFTAAVADVPLVVLGLKHQVGEQAERSLEEIEVAFVDDSAFLAWGRVARGLVGEPEAQGAGGVAGAELYDLRRVAKV